MTNQLPLGLYVGNPNGNDAGAMATFKTNFDAFVTLMRGRRPATMNTFTDFSQDPSQWPSNAGWDAWSWAQTGDAYVGPNAGVIPVIGVPLASSGGGWGNVDTFYKAIVTGTYDAAYQGIVTAWAGSGYKHVKFRPAYEFDGNFMPWAPGNTSAPTADTDFIAAFQHVVTVMRAQAQSSGIQVDIIWNPADINWAATDPENLYPGDAYVDVISSDAYAPCYPEDLTNWATPPSQEPDKATWLASAVNRESFWSHPGENQWQPEGQGYGMTRALAFAKAHNKPFAISECGTGNQSTDTGPLDDGDFPVWLAKTLTAAQDDGLVIDHVNIWATNQSDGAWGVLDGSKPLGAAGWQAGWATPAVAPIPAPTPIIVPTPTPTEESNMATVTFNMSEDAYQGDAVAVIAVDGGPAAQTTVTALESQGKTQAISLTLAPGSHNVTMNMLQDAYGGSAAQDRNLYLKNVTIDGVDQGISRNFMTADPQTFSLTVPVPLTLTDVAASVAAVKADLDAFRAELDASIAKVIAAIAAIPTTTGGSGSTAPFLLNTSFPADWTALTVSPTDSLQAALAVAAKGFALTLSPGTYKQVQNVPSGLDGWTIQSSTGNPHDVTVDGGGGLTVSANNAATAGTPGRLSEGKGVFHLSSPGTIKGLTVTGGGLAAQGSHDGQAGVYWECSNGTCATIDCIITGNQNGIFGNSTNANVAYVHTNCLFTNNGTDGGSHDTYVEGSNSSQTVSKCILPGSNAGNDLKSRVATVSIDGCFIGSQNSNRWYDCADGATLTVSNSTLVGNDTGENVAADGDESTSLAPGNATWTNNTYYVGNREEDLCTAGTFNATNTTVLFTGPQGNIINSKGTPLTGLVPTSPTAGQTFASYPSVPAYPLAAF